MLLSSSGCPICTRSDPPLENHPEKKESKESKQERKIIVWWLLRFAKLLTYDTLLVLENKCWRFIFLFFFLFCNFVYLPQSFQIKTYSSHTVHTAKPSLTSPDVLSTAADKIPSGHSWINQQTIRQWNVWHEWVTERHRQVAVSSFHVPLLWTGNNNQSEKGNGIHVTSNHNQWLSSVSHRNKKIIHKINGCDWPSQIQDVQNSVQASAGAN